MIPSYFWGGSKFQLFFYFWKTSFRNPSRRRSALCHYAVSPHLAQLEAALHCSLVAEGLAEGLVGRGKVVKSGHEDIPAMIAIYIPSGELT